jgi:hypothetical protein
MWRPRPRRTSARLRRLPPRTPTLGRLRLGRPPSPSARSQPRPTTPQFWEPGGPQPFFPRNRPATFPYPPAAIRSASSASGRVNRPQFAPLLVRGRARVRSGRYEVLPSEVASEALVDLEIYGRRPLVLIATRSRLGRSPSLSVPSGNSVGVSPNRVRPMAGALWRSPGGAIRSPGPLTGAGSARAFSSPPGPVTTRKRSSRGGWWSSCGRMSTR